MRLAKADVPFRLKSPFEPVTDRLVQQNARPTRAEHHSHGTRRCGLRFEIHERLPHGLTPERQRLIAGHEVGQ